MKYVCAVWGLRARGRKKSAVSSQTSGEQSGQSRKEATTTESDDILRT